MPSGQVLLGSVHGWIGRRHFRNSHIQHSLPCLYLSLDVLHTDRSDLNVFLRIQDRNLLRSFDNWFYDPCFMENISGLLAWRPWHCVLDSSSHGPTPQGWSSQPVDRLVRTHIMALSSAASALRNAVLLHLRVPASSTSAINALPTFTNIITRGFGGGFLERDSVVERVLFVAKHFEKVDPAKVRTFYLLAIMGRPDAIIITFSPSMQVTPEANFEKDLGLDSLDVVELVMALEEEFGVEIPDAEADKIASVSEAVNYIISNPLAK